MHRPCKACVRDFGRGSRVDGRPGRSLAIRALMICRACGLLAVGGGTRALWCRRSAARRAAEGALVLALTRAPWRRGASCNEVLVNRGAREESGRSFLRDHAGFEVRLSALGDELEPVGAVVGLGVAQRFE
jgi:hypothetical protein